MKRYDDWNPRKTNPPFVKSTVDSIFSSPPQASGLPNATGVPAHVEHLPLQTAFKSAVSQGIDQSLKKINKSILLNKDIRFDMLFVNVYSSSSPLVEQYGLDVGRLYLCRIRLTGYKWLVEFISEPRCFEVLRKMGCKLE